MLWQLFLVTLTHLDAKCRTVSLIPLQNHLLSKTRSVMSSRISQGSSEASFPFVGYRELKCHGGSPGTLENGFSSLLFL